MLDYIYGSWSGSAGLLKLEGFQVVWEALGVGARTDVQNYESGGSGRPRAGITDRHVLWRSHCSELNGAPPPLKKKGGKKEKHKLKSTGACT